MKVLGNNILVKVPETGERRSASGLYIASTTSDDQMLWGTVVEVGEGRLLDNGQLVEPTVKQGDEVCFPKFNSSLVTVDNVKFYVLPETSVLLVKET